MSSPTPTLPVTVARQIDAVCAAFEAAWRGGGRPDLAAFADGMTDLGRRKLLLELIQLDAYYRRQAGDAPTVPDYVARFPELDPDAVAAATDTVPSTPAAPAAPLIGGYQVVRELGRGGMGVVYEARDARLNRTVALKVIRAGELASAAEVDRFRKEAEAVARLQHPNVVQVFEVNEWTPPGGAAAPYFALEFVPGGTLAAQFDRTPQPPRAAAELIAAVARAVHHAHENGIVHRDLKPANVLLAADGTPKVTDFGLAKRLDADDPHTRTGAILGTPSYMSPEQAAGRTKEIGPAADVWALGAMLYEAVTGGPPFRGENAVSTLEQVRTSDPVAPRRLVGTVPRDLETICLKCLQKEPAKRYATAAELADDVRRFLDGRPILARPTPTWERGWKFVRRRPWASGFATVAAASLFAALAILVVSNAEVRSAYRGEKKAREELDGKNDELTGVNRVLTKTVGELDSANKQVTAEKTRAEESLRAKTAALEKEERVGYHRTLALALRELEANNLAGFNQLLNDCPAHLRNWEWHYLRRLRGAGVLTVVGPPPASGVAFTPDGSQLAVAYGNGTYVYDVATGRVVFPVLAFTHGVALAQDGKVLATQEHKNLLVARIGQPGPLTRIPVFDGDPVKIGAFALTPDGRTAVTAVRDDNDVRVWDLSDGRVVGTLKVPAGKFSSSVVAVAVSRDGRSVAACVPPDRVLVWDLTTKQARALPWKLGDEPTCVAFGPTADQLLVGLTRMDATPSSGAVLLDLKTGQPTARFLGHLGQVRHAALSRDGRRVLTVGAMDLVARVWDAGTGGEVRTVRLAIPTTKTIAGGPVLAAALSPDGGRVAVAQADGRVVVYDGRVSPAVRALLDQPGRVVTAPGFRSPPPQEPADPGWNPADAAAIRRECHVLGEGVSRQRNVSPDGRWSADVTEVTRTAPDGTTTRVHVNVARLYERVGKERVLRHTLRGHEETIASATFSPDGAVLATVDFGGRIRLWRTVTGESVHPLAGPTGRGPTVRFSPDGRFLAAAGVGELRTWDVATGAPLGPHVPLAQPLAALAFSPDGRTVVAGSGDGRVVFITPATGEVRRPAAGHRRGVSAVGFLAGGRAFSFGDEVLKIWDPVHAEEVLSVSGISTQPPPPKGPGPPG